MHILLTGGTGQVGRFIAARLRRDGHQLTFLSRTPPQLEPELDLEPGGHLEAGPDGHVVWDLAAGQVDLPPADVLIHCALSHVPGKYRGGEGDDPHGFIHLNVEGTQALFDSARTSGINHCVFLSSRAVYTEADNWAVLTEASGTEPRSLYGQVKRAGEDALHLLCEGPFRGTVLRATGVYGCPPGGSGHKWDALFADFAAGKTILPRLGTEVHGEDLAAAVAVAVGKRPEQASPFEIYNVSDQLVDRQDLLKLYQDVHAVSGRLPQRAPGPVGVMDVAKLVRLGWAPGGKAKLQDFLRSLPAPVAD